MANPQLEDGKTEIANEIVEALAKTHFTSAETRVLWAIFRKTYGWHKITDRISYTQLEELTNMSRWHIAPAVKKLVARNIITVNGTGYMLEYGLQKDYDKWKIITDTGNKIITDSSNESLPIPVTKSKSKSLPILEESLPIPVTKSLPISVTTKAINHITNTTLLPEWINKETWEGFIEMRKNKKTTPTAYAIRLMIKDLTKWRADGEDPNAILEEAIKRNWTGLWSLKNKQNQSYGVKHEPERYKED